MGLLEWSTALQAEIDGCDPHILHHHMVSTLDAQPADSRDAMTEKVLD
jgi:hypothetical protein